MSQPPLTPTSRGMPQAPGRAPQGLAALRPGAETLLIRGTTPGPPPTPPTLQACVPPARPSAVLAGAPEARRPARRADERSMMT